MYNHQSENSTYIIVTDKGIKNLLPLEDILRVESSRIYSVFYMKNCKRQYVSSNNLGKVYQQLKQNNFLRVHKSHIINLEEVKAYQQGRGGKVVMKNNIVITVATRRKTELLQSLKNLNRNANQKNVNEKKTYYPSKQINSIK